ncbi:ABC transporter permease [Streptomyces tateyamensis]|uniref:ABC transporter permease n=1 Tax=Streptomyces tateyamensis TaxID=565073 RepID=A0A2V4P780_9ACTN|nr:ABC transporter permease [Streptomyces tateyamensis]
MQTLVIALASMMAVTASVLGGSLLVASNAPFDHAFARGHGAHLTVQYDAAKATADQLAATTRVTGVTAAAGPFRTATVDPAPGAGLDLPAGMKLSPMRLVGRAEAGGPVDQVSLLAGHWAAGPGQLVASADYSGAQLTVGQQLRVGATELTVVGVARSVSATADGWVTPDQAVTLGGVPGWQLLYRFAQAGAGADLAADRAAVTAAAPAGAAVGSRGWLDVKAGNTKSTGLFLPFLTAFGLLGLGMSVLIVGNVVAGAVGSGTRRIGILKAIGLTPAQVVGAYLVQALVPAAAGTLVGAVLGNVGAGAVLSGAEQVYGTSSLSVAPWVDAAVVAGTLLLVAGTAFAAALRAGRLRTVEALAVGRTPKAGRGRAATRIAVRLPLPRPVTLGLARPFARPARSLAMVSAVLLGTVAVTFAFGLGSSLQRIQQAKQSTADVTVIGALPPGAAGPPGSGPGNSSGNVAGNATRSGDTAAMLAAIQAQPGTSAVFGTAHTEVGAVGTTGSVAVTAFLGDASWGGFQLVAGRWFHGAGEAVAPTGFLTATGTRIGDTVTVTDHGQQLRVRISGEAFSTQNDGLALLTDAATLAAAEPDLEADLFYVALKHGTDPDAYTDALNTALAPTGARAETGGGGGASQLLIVLDSLTALLTLMLIAVAGLGVLNAVVLDTRDRVRDLGVAKALGMTPRQTVATVLASVALIGLAGGVAGVPVGVWLQHLVVPAMAHSAGLRLPPAILSVYGPVDLLPLLLGGPLLALLGALLPATWAARTRTAVALRTE